MPSHTFLARARDSGLGEFLITSHVLDPYVVFPPWGEVVRETGWSRSIGHPPLSSASPVNLRLRVGPRALSEKKRIREQGVKNLVCQSVSL